jgi:hypothetical protein
MDAVANQNGVFINDTPTSMAELQHGDRIRAGEFQVVYEADPETEPASVEEPAPKANELPEFLAKTLPLPRVPKLTSDSATANDEGAEDTFAPLAKTLPLPAASSKKVEAEPSEPPALLAPEAPSAFFSAQPKEESQATHEERISTQNIAKLAASAAAAAREHMPLKPLAPQFTPPPLGPVPKQPTSKPAPPPDTRTLRVSQATVSVVCCMVAVLAWSALETLRPSWPDFSTISLLKAGCYVVGAMGLGIGMGSLASATHPKGRPQAMLPWLAVSCTILGAFLAFFVLALPIGTVTVTGSRDGVAELVENIQHLSVMVSPQFSWFRLVEDILQPWSMLALVVSSWAAYRRAGE